MSSPEEILQLTIRRYYSELNLQQMISSTIKYFLITYIDQSQQIEVQDIDSLAKTTLLLSDSDGGLDRRNHR